MDRFATIACLVLALMGCCIVAASLADPVADTGDLRRRDAVGHVRPDSGYLATAHRAAGVSLAALAVAPPLARLLAGPEHPRLSSGRAGRGSLRRRRTSFTAHIMRWACGVRRAESPRRGVFRGGVLQIRPASLRRRRPLATAAAFAFQFVLTDWPS